MAATTMNASTVRSRRRARLEQAHEGDDERQPDGSSDAVGRRPRCSRSRGSVAVARRPSPGSLSRRTRPSSVGGRPRGRRRSARVEDLDGRRQRRELSGAASRQQGLAADGGADDDRAPVAGVGLPHDQALGLHGVDEAGHGRWPHTLGGGQLAEGPWSAEHQQRERREACPGEAIAGVARGRAGAAGPCSGSASRAASSVASAVACAGAPIRWRPCPSAAARVAGSAASVGRQQLLRDLAVATTPRSRAAPDGPSLPLSFDFLPIGCPGWPTLAKAVAGSTAAPILAGAPASGGRRHARVAEAGHEMVVDDAHRLEAGVDDDRTDEAEAARPQGAREPRHQGACGPGRRPGAAMRVDDRRAVRRRTTGRRRARPPRRAGAGRPARCRGRRATLARLRTMRGSPSSSAWRSSS